MKTANPDACHIFPFSANNSSNKVLRLRSSSDIIRYWISQPTLITSGVSCSDKAWNMLCLNTQMHRWWGECLWALKCLGVDSIQSDEEAVITLQFYWMPSTSRSGTSGKPWERKIDLAAGEGEKMVHEWKQKLQLGYSEAEGAATRIGAFNIITGRRLQSGHTFELSMKREDAPKMKQMVDLQWASIQLATMSGAAGQPEFLVHRGDEDDSEEGLDRAETSSV